jgi:outer membrane protein
MNKALTRSAAIAALALLGATSALAEDGADWRVRVGAGAQLVPDFPGADSDRVLPLFDLSFVRGSEPFRFKAADDSPGLRLVSTDRFAFGPVVNLQPKRKESDVGAAVGSVPMTVEAGAFAAYFPIPSLRLRAEVRKGIGGHDGVVGAIGADQIWRDGDRYVFSIGPRLLFSDSRYQREYFGISPAASLATGLPVYRPSSGIHGVGLNSGIYYQFSPKWGLFGFARYTRLVGDAADSPLIRAFGSRNQLSGGLGLTYTFVVHR